MTDEQQADEIRWKGGAPGEASNGDGKVMERREENRYDDEDEGKKATGGEEDEIGMERGEKKAIVEN